MMLVREATDVTLLTTFAALTHLIHVAVTKGGEADYRAQRDLVEAEILRRMAS